MSFGGVREKPPERSGGGGVFSTNISFKRLVNSPAWKHRFRGHLYESVQVWPDDMPDDSTTVVKKWPANASVNRSCRYTSLLFFCFTDNHRPTASELLSDPCVVGRRKKLAGDTRLFFRIAFIVPSANMNKY